MKPRATLPSSFWILTTLEVRGGRGGWCRGYRLSCMVWGSVNVGCQHGHDLFVRERCLVVTAKCQSKMFDSCNDVEGWPDCLSQSFLGDCCHGRWREVSACDERHRHYSPLQRLGLVVMMQSVQSVEEKVSVSIIKSWLRTVTSGMVATMTPKAGL